MTILSTVIDDFKKEIRRMLVGMKTQEKVKKMRVLVNSGNTAGGILIIAAIFGNFLNFLYNAYLVRAVSIEDFGLISLIGSFLFLSTIPLGALGRAVTHKGAYFLGEYKTTIKDFWRQIRKRAIVIGIFVTILWLLASGYLVNFFKAPALHPFILFAPVWLIGIVSAVDGGFLSGNLKFKVIAVLIVAEAFAKLFFTWILIRFGFVHYIYAAIPASMALTFFVGWFFASNLKAKKVNIDRKKILEFPTKFFLNSILTTVTLVAFISLDVILAKHYLEPKEAGQYALISLVGKMIFIIGGLFSQFVVPVVSREEGASGNSKHIFAKLLIASATLSFLAYIAIGLFGFLTVPVLFGSQALPILYLLPFYGFSMLCFTIASTIVSFYQIRKKYFFTYVSFILATVQIIGIVLFHSSLSQIVWVMTAVGITNLAAILILNLAYKTLITVFRNLVDLLSIFSHIPLIEPQKASVKKILIFNWRDTKHIWAGGAEVYIHEIAKRLVKNGYDITVFCGNDGKSLRNETVDSVNIIRRGGFYTVYVWAFLYYIFKFRNKFDVIVDSENGIPFFTPLYAKEPVIGLVHHVHQEIFRKHLVPPFSQIAQFLEGKLMPFVYKNKKMITVSDSSKAAMEAIGFGKTDVISVINPGVDHSFFKPMGKSEKPTILYLGRLKPYKSVDILIRAMSQVANDVPDIILTIVGDGESRIDLEKLVHKLNLQNVVNFAGKVSERVKAELLAKSWVMVQPSKIEGWGITAIEANASGTPVVASNVPGLCDSVRNPHSGFLVAWGDSKKLAQKVNFLIKNKKMRRKMEKGSVKWSRGFTWERSSDALMKLF